MYDSVEPWIQGRVNPAVIDTLNKHLEIIFSYVDLHAGGKQTSHNLSITSHWRTFDAVTVTSLMYKWFYSRIMVDLIQDYIDTSQAFIDTFDL